MNTPPYDLEAIRSALQRVVGECDVQARLARDPVGLVREAKGEADREIAALLASCLAFGNVTALRASIANVLSRLQPSLAASLDDPVVARKRLAGVGHRMLRADEITRVLLGARSLQRAHGSLGRRFADLLASNQQQLRPALCAWTSELRDRSGLESDGERRGPAHILADPSKSSSCKRLLLLLRWMVRRDDGVDLGLWREVSPSVLLIPVDTHIHRLARNLGMTSCSGPSWSVAEQITAVLRRIDPDDPVRFDFALCHMGMLQGCPSKRDPADCEGCGVRGACKYWKRG